MFGLTETLAEPQTREGDAVHPAGADLISSEEQTPKSAMSNFTYREITFSHSVASVPGVQSSVTRTSGCLTDVLHVRND